MGKCLPNILNTTVTVIENEILEIRNTYTDLELKGKKSNCFMYAHTNSSTVQNK